MPLTGRLQSTTYSSIPTTTSHTECVYSKKKQKKNFIGKFPNSDYSFWPNVLAERTGDMLMKVMLLPRSTKLLLDLRLTAVNSQTHFNCVNRCAQLHTSHVYCVCMCTCTDRNLRELVVLYMYRDVIYRR